MQGKKRYLALILFVIIGLVTFSFANPNEELEPVDSNVKKVSESENKTDAEKAVEQAELRPSTETVEEAEEIIEESVTNTEVRQELTQRLEVVEEAIDASELVATVERMVEEAEDKDDILASEIYFNDNDVEVITGNMDPGDVKDNLEDRINTLNEIFDDNEAPTIIGIEPGAVTKENIKITIEDTNEVTTTVTLNNEEIPFAEEFNEEGVYTINVVDAAHNPATITFTIDRTKPKFENLKSGGHYDSIDEIVVDDATETTVTIKNNDTNETGLVVPLTTDATYVVTATDAAGNSNTIYVAIDNTKPTISGVTNNSVVAKAENVYVRDKFLTYVKIVGPNSKGEIKTYEFDREDFTVGEKNENFELKWKANYHGTYTVYGEDKKGNNYTETFTIDKVAPKFEGLASREVDIEYYKVEVTDDTKTTITLQKDHGSWVIIENGYELTEEGTYQLKAVDAAGNTYTTWIHIDKTAPEIYGIEKELTNSCVSISAFDRYLNSVTIDDVKYGRKSPVPFVGNGQNENFTFTAPEAVCSEGEHTIIAKDKAGKTTKKTFTIETEPPTLTITEKGNTIYVRGKDKLSLKYTIKKDGKTIHTVDSETCGCGNYFSITWLAKQHGDGEYTIEIVDAAGNSASSKAFVDTTSPIVVPSYTEKTIEINSVKEFKDYPTFEITDNSNKEVNQELVSGSVDITKTGTYEIDYKFTDFRSNSTNIKITVKVIDTTPPVVVPSYAEKTVEGDKTNEFEDYPTFELSDNSKGNINKEVIAEKVDITKVGVYELKYKFTDDAGNSTEVVIPVSVVDTTPAKLTLPFPMGKETYEYRIESGTKVELDEIAATLTDNIDKNGKLKPTSADLLIGKKEENTYNYDLSQGINTNYAGRYNLKYKYTDAAGNLSELTLLLFMKDTQKPKLTINKEDKKVFVKGEDATKLTFRIAKDDNEVLVVNDKTEFEITDLATTYGDGFYKVELSDAGKNKVSEIVEIDLNAPVVEFDKTELTIEEDSVKEFKEEDHLTIKVTDASNNIKKEVTGKVDTTQYGEYTLEYKFTDNVGNFTTQTIKVNVVDTKVPTIDNIEQDTHYKKIIPEVKDKHLKNTYYKVSYLDGKVSAVLPYKEGTELNVYGNYEITAIDESGNKTTKSFVVDPIKPQILLLDELKVIRGDLIPIKPVIIEPNIDTITVTKDDKPYEYNLGDQLTEHGEYVITVKDKAGNEATSTFNMDNKAPILIEPVMGGVYKDVKVTMLEENINEDALVLLKKTRTEKIGKLEIPIYEKVEYNYGDTITEEGQYYVVVADKALNVTYAKFTIDRTPPTSNLVEGEVYNEVTPEIYEENLLTSIITRNSYEVVYLNKTGPITKPGTYKLYVQDAALNEPLEVNFKVDGYVAPTIELENEALESNAASDSNTKTVYEMLNSQTKLNVRGIASDNITKYPEEAKYVTPTITKYVNGIQEGEAFTAGELDISENNVSYNLTWSVKDEAGNEGIRTLTIKVVNIIYEVRLNNTNFSEVYNGKAHSVPTEIKGTVVKIKDGIEDTTFDSSSATVTYSIKDDVELKDAKTYEKAIVATTIVNGQSYSSYANLIIVPAELKVKENFKPTLSKGQTSKDISIPFVNQNGEEVANVNASTTIYKEEQANYEIDAGWFGKYNLNLGKQYVPKGKDYITDAGNYEIVVYVLPTSNYTFDSTAKITGIDFEKTAKEVLKTMNFQNPTIYTDEETLNNSIKFSGYNID